MALPVTIRPYTPSDLPGLARVYLESAQHHASLDPEVYRVPSPEEVRARYETRLPHVQITLVAVRGAEVVGFVDAQMLRSSDAMLRACYYCHVAELAVAQECRSEGYGAQLLAAAEQWGIEQGAEVISLDFHIANLRAAAFYQKRMGYRLTSHTAIKFVNRSGAETPLSSDTH